MEVSNETSDICALIWGSENRLSSCMLSTLIFTILAPPSSSQSYLHPHLHYPSSTLILTILPPPSSSQSYLHLHPTSTLIFTILPPPSSSQSYLHPHLPHTDHKKTDFLKEIDMMKLVAEGNIIHVVSFVGCVTVQEPLCLNTEFVRHGDLLAYLQNIRRMVRCQPRDAPVGQVKWMDVIQNHTWGELPWKWKAFESIIDQEFTTASDVWSYGVVLREIATKVLETECCRETLLLHLKAKFDVILLSQEDNPYNQFNINVAMPYYHTHPPTEGGACQEEEEGEEERSEQSPVAQDQTIPAPLTIPSNAVPPEEEEEEEEEENIDTDIACMLYTLVLYDPLCSTNVMLLILA
ncbi:hypothetical protein EMCRGX_G013635 [Ephydatia muelleri]